LRIRAGSQKYLKTIPVLLRENTVIREVFPVYPLKNRRFL